VIGSIALKDALLALLTVSLNSGAQLMLRGAALRGAEALNPMSLLKSPLFMAALVCYGGSVLTWVTVLKRVPLPSAIPFVALMYVVVPLAAKFIYDDPFTLRMGLGIGFIVVGLLIVVNAAPA
jgi:undecaprenyl phosphate-alpha-L-ara4N flippase subunit ArnE